MDAFYWNDHLPHSVEALIAAPNDPRAEALQERFAHMYRLKSVDEVPLVVFNKDNKCAPFQPYGTRGYIDPNARFDYRVNGVPSRWSSPGAMPRTQRGC